jgi:hypothetical protein
VIFSATVIPKTHSEKMRQFFTRRNNKQGQAAPPLLQPTIRPFYARRYSVSS